jgi:HD superfamily phosphodiesterase
VAAPLLSVDDGELLAGAALLHDIGYVPELAHTGFHALDDARYLRRVGGSGRLVNLVAHHSWRGDFKAAVERTERRLQVAGIAHA